MADSGAVTRVAQALVSVLNRRLTAMGAAGFTRQPRAVLVTSEDINRKQANGGGNGNGELQPPALSLFVYRVAVNRATRAAWSAVGHVDGRARLPLDVHMLLTPWGANAVDELTLLGRGLLALEESAFVAAPLLPADNGFGAAEAVQAAIDDVEVDVVMRVFETLQAPYRLSVPLVARVVRIEGAAAPAPDVGTVIAGLTPSTTP